MKTRIKVGKSAMDSSPMYYPQYYREGKHVGDAVATLIFFSVVIGSQWGLSADQETIITTAVIAAALAALAYFNKGLRSIYFVSDHSYGIRDFCHPNMRQDNYSMYESDAKRAVDEFLKFGHQSMPENHNIINYPGEDK
jgi:hypothetical protein